MTPAIPAAAIPEAVTAADIPAGMAVTAAEIMRVPDTILKTTMTAVYATVPSCAPTAPEMADLPAPAATAPETASIATAAVSAPVMVCSLNVVPAMAPVNVSCVTVPESGSAESATAEADASTATDAVFKLKSFRSV